MFLGRIEGKVWATAKDDRLDAVRLCLMQQVDEHERPVGEVMVAVDSIGVSEGDLVFWVNSTEAGFVRPDRGLPTEVSIVGLVDRIDLDSRVKD
jgi:ethanolamine utilization protein EutN